jgi:hypothetical protein
LRHSHLSPLLSACGEGENDKTLNNLFYAPIAN